MIELELDATVPQDVEAEAALLATLCAPGAECAAAWACLRLQEEDFLHPAHQGLFKALGALLDQQQEINAITLKAEAQDLGVLHRIGGYQGIIEILSGDEVGKPEVLVRILQEKTRLRNLIRLGQTLITQAQEGQPSKRILEALNEKTSKLTTVDESKAPQHMGQIASTHLAEVFETIQHGDPRGIRTGYMRFDYLTHGFHPGQLILLAARPGVGKTALANNWLLNMTRKGHGSLFISLEMTNKEVYGRLLAAEAGVNLKEALESRQLDHQLAQRLGAASERLENLPIYLYDESKLTAREIVNQVDRLITRTNGRIQVVFIDYLGLIDKPENSRRNDSALIGDISRGLKILAKERQLVVVAMAQMNRQVENRAGGRPQLSDLRESGALEQDADMVCFIHRKVIAEAGEEPTTEGELIIAKNRGGMVGVIPMAFDGGTTTYRELERTTDEQEPPKLVKKGRKG